MGIGRGEGHGVDRAAIERRVDSTLAVKARGEPQVRSRQETSGPSTACAVAEVQKPVAAAAAMAAVRSVPNVRMPLVLPLLYLDALAGRADRAGTAAGHPVAI